MAFWHVRSPAQTPTVANTGIPPMLANSTAVMLKWSSKMPYRKVDRYVNAATCV